MKSTREKKIKLLFFIIVIVLSCFMLFMVIEENVLLLNTQQQKKLAIKTEMREKLEIAISELHTEKEEVVTIKDVTQEYLSGKLVDYEIIVTENETGNIKNIEMKKADEIETFIIDRDLNITGENDKLRFSYDLGEINGNRMSILIHVQNSEEGIDRINLPDKETIIAKMEKNEVGIDYVVEMDTEYKIPIISGDGDVEEKRIYIPSLEVSVWNKYGIITKQRYKEMVSPAGKMSFSNANYSGSIQGSMNTQTRKMELCLF